MMNDEELDALRRVLDRYAPDDLKQYRESGKPSDHIAEAWLTLGMYWKAGPYRNHRNLSFHETKKEMPDDRTKGLR